MRQSWFDHQKSKIRKIIDFSQRKINTWLKLSVSTAKSIVTFEVNLSSKARIETIFPLLKQTE